MGHPTHITRRELLDERALEYVDEVIPTKPLRIASTFSPGAVGVVLVGSPLAVLGSPSHAARSFLATKLRVGASSPNVWFAVVHSTEGTVDTPYLEAAGEELALGELRSPIFSTGPGSLRAYALGATNATGTPPGFAGVGPGTPAGVNAFSLELEGHVVGRVS